MTALKLLKAGEIRLAQSYCLPRRTLRGIICPQRCRKLCCFAQERLIAHSSGEMCLLLRAAGNLPNQHC